MSQFEVMRSVSDLVGFIKDKVNLNLVELKATNEIKIQDLEFDRLLRMIDLSISQGLTLGIVNVESTIKTFEKELLKKTKRK